MREISAAADAYLHDHLWGVLTTIRSSGAPQVSMVAYAWNGNDLVISCRSSAAKFVNASQRPHVAFSVADDVDCATVVGQAVVHRTGRERDALTARVRDRLADGAPWAAEILDREIASGLDAATRVTITVIPESVRLVQPQG